MIINMYKYWGKAKPPKDTTGATYHLLVYHSLDVAAVGKAILERQPDWTQPLQTQLNLTLEQATILVIFFLAIHDLGKFAESFQGLNVEVMQHLQGIASNQAYHLRHDSMGWLIWQSLIWSKAWQAEVLPLDRRVDQESWSAIIAAFVKAVTGHHGRPPVEQFPNLANYFSPQSQEDTWQFTQAVKDFLFTDLPKWLWDDNLELNAPKVSWLVAGFAILCDWVGSNQTYFPYCDQEMPLVDYWEKHALPQARKALDALAILPVQINPHTGIRVLFDKISQPSPLQEYVSSSDCILLDEPQMFIIEEATGAGKTEAAIVLAHRLMAQKLAQGLFIGLPTMATANAMYKRIGQCYAQMFTEPTSLVLAHGQRHLSKDFKLAIRENLGMEAQPTDKSYAKDEDSASALCSAWLADSRKKSLLASVGVGTIDQALLAALPSKHQSLRLYGLASKVLIVDEVHAYDPYMNKLLNALLKFQAALGGSAILLSATLPQQMRQNLAKSFSNGLAIWKNERLPKLALDPAPQYPWLTQVGSSCYEKQLTSRPGTERTARIQILNQPPINLIKEWVSAGRCVCWIRNTVNDATEAYQELRKILPESQLTLFHARFAMGERLEIEKSVLENFGATSTAKDRQGKVVIATQVVEQSLDLDFDIIISDLAPIDLVIQRLGRQMRHPRDKEGNRLDNKQDSDQRGEICFYLYAPEFTLTPTTAWYSSFAPGAAFVYPHHGQIWLTLKYLSENPLLVLPQQSRTLISAVYDDNAQLLIPDTLQKAEVRQDGKDSAAKSVAALNSLKLEAGYSDTSGQWLPDTVTPTRLADPSLTLRLARWTGTELEPWFNEGEFAWDMSQLNIRASLITGIDMKFPPDLQQAYEKLLPLLPDKGKYSLLLPLIAQDGQWRGLASKDDQPIKVIYDQILGFRIEK